MFGGLRQPQGAQLEFGLGSVGFLDILHKTLSWSRSRYEAVWCSCHLMLFNYKTIAPSVPESGKASFAALSCDLPFLPQLNYQSLPCSASVSAQAVILQSLYRLPTSGSSSCNGHFIQRMLNTSALAAFNEFSAADITT